MARKLTSFFLVIGFAATVIADETAISLSQTDVQAAIDAADEGETVILPAGSVTWDVTGVSIANKSIWLTGAGQTMPGGTQITSTNGGNANLYINGCGTKRVDVSNIRWVVSTGGTLSIRTGPSNANNTNFRLHHMTFEQTISARGIQTNGNSNGSLIDNCTFYSTANLSIQGITVYGNGNYFKVPGNTAASYPAGSAWKSGPNFGSNDFLFIEDCVFDYDYPNDAAVEGYSGAKYVLRYCDIYNVTPGAHGLDSTICGTHSWEVYENDYYSVPGGLEFVFAARSGTGVIYNNRGHGDVGRPWVMQLLSYRSEGDSIIYNLAFRSTHTGGTHATILTDSTASFGNLALPQSPYTIYNFTDGSIGKVISNTGTTATVAGLTGGVDNQWELNDDYGLASQQGGMQSGINAYDGNEAVTTGSGLHDGGANQTILTDNGRTWTVNQFTAAGATGIQHSIWNTVDGSHGRITANTADTVTAKMVGGSENDWDNNDTYVITYGYPGLEQIGTTGPVTLGTYGATLVKEPFYEWNNVYNPGAEADLLDIQRGPSTDGALQALGIARPYSTDNIVQNRDYFVNTARPGYTPYAYPHPLRGGENRPRTPGKARKGVLIR